VSLAPGGPYPFSAVIDFIWDAEAGGVSVYATMYNADGSTNQQVVFYTIAALADLAIGVGLQTGVTVTTGPFVVAVNQFTLLQS
jgi:hypothetical protein